MAQLIVANVEGVAIILSESDERNMFIQKQLDGNNTSRSISNCEIDSSASEEAGLSLTKQCLLFRTFWNLMRSSLTSHDI